MKHPDPTLFTPLHVRRSEDEPLPAEEGTHYVLGSTGLYVCRNTPLFSSCVPARGWPSELAPVKPRLELRYPRIPQAQLEQIVGLFGRVADLHNAEAAVLLVQDRNTNEPSFVVPYQRARVCRSWNGGHYPLDVSYTVPIDLAPELSVLGTVHSHVGAPAYSSYQDKQDESFRSGLHVVVGRIFNEPPELHCEFVVDGTRFPVDPEQVLEGYARRNTSVPDVWVERVHVEVDQPTWQEDYDDGRWGRGRSGRGVQ